MPRALTIHRTLVTPPERERFQAQLRRKRDYYAKANCQFWAFEEAELPGAFLEFVEAADRETLTRAHEDAPDPVINPNRVYMEVELSK
jgi:hypothetical protein